MVPMEPIPGSDHVTRHCGPKRLDENDWPTAEAFYRDEGEKSISVNWLEETGADTLNNRLDAVRAELASYRTIRKSHRLAMLNVGDALAALQREKQLAVGFRHEPEPGKPTHSGIHGMGVHDHTVGIILQGVVTHVFEAMPSDEGAV